MNTTQRKYAIKTAYEILSKKFDEVYAVNQKEVDYFNDKVKVTIKDLCNKISNNKVLPLNPGVDSNQLLTNSKIRDIFNIQSIEKEKIKNLKLKPNQIPKGFPRIVLKNPALPEDTYKYNCGTQFNFEHTYKAAIKICKAMDNAANQLMLGSNSEALNALKELEDKTFL